MALVTSKSTVCPCATAPRVASAGPSIAGWVFQVTVPSFHAQSVIGWRRPPARAPPAQVSAVVQALPSVQATVFGVFTQPVAGSHESSVQTFASLQFGAGPPTQTPPAQVSPVVQALPSVQGAVFGVFTQPVAGSQASVVHTLPSLQLRAGPPTQTPPAQLSAVVQALPSLHAATVGVPPPHTPAPSHVAAVRQGVGLAQGAPAGSNWHVDEQQSPATVLPSSHCSPGSRTPLPQTAAIFPMRLKRLV